MISSFGISSFEASLLGALASGVATWSLLEYGLHRGLGHYRKTQPNPFSIEHTRHHSEGNYFAPSSKKALTACVVTLLLSYPAVTLLGSAAGVCYVVGFVGMYITYEVVHRRDHTHPGVGRYARFLRRHHFYHHFTDPSSNHGVTTPIWDWVFGTLRKPGLIRVPRKLAMPWLLDPDTDEVKAAYAEHYEIFGRS